MQSLSEVPRRIRCCRLSSLLLTDFGMSTIGMITPMSSSYYGEWIWGEMGCAYDGFMHFVIGEFFIHYNRLNQLLLM